VTSVTASRADPPLGLAFPFVQFGELQGASPFKSPEYGIHEFRSPFNPRSFRSPFRGSKRPDGQPRDSSRNAPAPAGPRIRRDTSGSASPEPSYRVYFVTAKMGEGRTATQRAICVR
jgi:hypothetical protein